MGIDKELLDRFEQDYQKIWNMATRLAGCAIANCIGGCACEFYSPGVGCILYYMRSGCQKAINFLREEAKKQEVKEMSVAEIEKILGYPIKVVKD